MIYHKASLLATTTQIKEQNLASAPKAPVTSPSPPPGNYGNHFPLALQFQCIPNSIALPLLNFTVNGILQNKCIHDRLFFFNIFVKFTQDLITAVVSSFSLFYNLQLYISKIYLSILLLFFPGKEKIYYLQQIRTLGIFPKIVSPIYLFYS